MRRIGEDVVEGARLAGPKIPWPTGWTAEEVIATLEPFVRQERAARLSQVIEARLGSVTGPGRLRNPHLRLAKPF